jgi:hypothetical protein
MAAIQRFNEPIHCTKNADTETVLQLISTADMYLDFSERSFIALSTAASLASLWHYK